MELESEIYGVGVRKSWSWSQMLSLSPRVMEFESESHVVLVSELCSLSLRVME